MRRSAAIGAAAAALVAGGAATGCGTDPETVAGRDPGPAAHDVVVTGGRVRGVRAEVAGWSPDRNNALPPQPAVRVTVRMTADDEWTLPGSNIELVVCAITGRRTVVGCDTVGSYVRDPPDDPRARTLEALITTGGQPVDDVVLLPDQYATGRSKKVDAKDGDDYARPRFPAHGEELERSG